MPVFSVPMPTRTNTSSNHGNSKNESTLLLLKERSIKMSIEDGEKLVTYYIYSDPKHYFSCPKLEFISDPRIEYIIEKLISKLKNENKLVTHFDLLPIEVENERISKYMLIFKVIP